MDNAGYTTLTRQSGLLREMQTVANNIANISTTGFRKEGLVFSEFIADLGDSGPSLSMATANAHTTFQVQGPLTQTNGTFDLAIEGDGFFLIETPQGQELTRAGSFTPNAQGELSTSAGNRLLDNGGAPIFVPPDATDVNVSSDGTLSVASQPVAQIGLYLPQVATDLSRRDGVSFAVKNGAKPLEGGTVVQGFLEDSNVNAIAEIARMIEVQRAYEFGQSLLNKEDERIRSVLQTLGK
jgi:flagellar basal-body rod protein FlgF